jgi:hypothetical protein
MALTALERLYSRTGQEAHDAANYAEARAYMRQCKCGEVKRCVDGSAGDFGAQIRALADQAYCNVMQHRERYVAAWVAETGLKPSESVLVQQDHGDGRTTFTAERRAIVADVGASVRAETGRCRCGHTVDLHRSIVVTEPSACRAAWCSCSRFLDVSRTASHADDGASSPPWMAEQYDSSTDGTDGMPAVPAIVVPGEPPMCATSPGLLEASTVTPTASQAGSDGAGPELSAEWWADWEAREAARPDRVVVTDWGLLFRASLLALLRSEIERADTLALSHDDRLRAVTWLREGLRAARHDPTTERALRLMAAAREVTGER